MQTKALGSCGSRLWAWKLSGTKALVNLGVFWTCHMCFGISETMRRVMGSGKEGER